MNGRARATIFILVIHFIRKSNAGDEKFSMDPTLHVRLEQAQKNIYPFIFSSKDITKKEGRKGRGRLAVSEPLSKAYIASW